MKGFSSNVLIETALQCWIWHNTAKDLTLITFDLICNFASTKVDKKHMLQSSLNHVMQQHIADKKHMLLKLIRPCHATT